MKKIILITLTLFANTLFAENNQSEKETLLKAQIIETIIVGESKNIKARFTDLKDKAIEIGIDEILINGKIYYTPKGNYQELKIVWENLENSKGLSKTVYAGLSQNFYSSMTTDDEQILPPQEITIKVNEQVLMSALKTLSEKNKPETSKVELDEKTVAQIKPQEQTSSATSGQSSVLPSTGFNTKEEEVVTTSTVEEKCPIRYSVDDLKAYEQISINTVDSNGNTLNAGACLDSGVTYELKKTYGEPCIPLVSNDKVYQSYRITGVVAGNDEIIRDCQVDLVENQIAVSTTTDQCGYEHHLDLGLSYQTERKFYELNNEIVNISQCETNKKPYQHSEEVCSYDLEISPGFAIPQVKTYIELDDKSQSLVQNCTTRSNQLAVVEKECVGSERYFHDFSASTSYLQKEKWVKNPFDNNKDTKVNECQISDVTFKHLEKTDNCTPVYEDHNLRSVQSYKPFIKDETQEVADIILSDTCANAKHIAYIKGGTTFLDGDILKQTAYTRPDQSVYQKMESTKKVGFTKSGTYYWTVPAGITEILVNAVGPEGDIMVTTDGNPFNYDYHKSSPTTSRQHSYAIGDTTIKYNNANVVTAKKGATIITSKNILSSSTSDPGDNGNPSTTIRYKAENSVPIIKTINVLPGKTLTIQVGRGPKLGVNIDVVDGFRTIGNWYFSNSNSGDNYRDATSYQGKNGSVTIKY